MPRLGAAGNRVHELQRQENLGTRADIHALEAWRGHADDGDSKSLNAQRMPEHAGVALEALAPELMADDGSPAIATATRAIVFGREQASKLRPHAEHIEGIAARYGTAQAADSAGFLQRELSRAPA